LPTNSRRDAQSKSATLQTLITNIVVSRRSQKRETLNTWQCEGVLEVKMADALAVLIELLEELDVVLP
jgi:hypothetical protein